ncbi:MAG: hypothetical protein RBS17_03195 [Coriobacteriia bacterium]|nr:hypothetical protein [Coriobacteriia bacterium]
MINKTRLAKVVFGSTFFTAMIVPAMALAQEGASEGLETNAQIAKFAAAAVAMCVACMSAAYAQAKIGSAAAGTLAERPEVAMNMIIMMALPEVIVLLGFVIAFMISQAA